MFYRNNVILHIAKEIDGVSNTFNNEMKSWIVSQGIRLARLVVEEFNQPQPICDWKSINEAPKGPFILLAKDSGYLTYDWCYEVGRWVEGYRDFWIDVYGDMIEPQPKYWCQLPNEPPKISTKLEKAIQQVKEVHPTVSEILIRQVVEASGLLKEDNNELENN